MNAFKTNQYPIKCEKCGTMIEPGQGIIRNTAENRDGSYDEDTRHWVGTCMYATECAQRVIDNGTNPEALIPPRPLSVSQQRHAQ